VANRYFVCSRWGSPVEFDLADEHPVDDAAITYFVRAFQFIERNYDFDGYTVCFAWGSLTKLPYVGERVIALVFGDEQCRVPPYAGSVRAVMKSYGFFPNYVTRHAPGRLIQIEIAELLRNLLVWLPTGWSWVCSPETRSRCHVIPLGYGVPVQFENIDFAQRPYIASFLGSIASESAEKGLRALIGTPKAYCRRGMMDALRQLRETYGSDTIVTSLTGGFEESLLDAGVVYSRVMARTKICLAPRGTSHETFRMYEGLLFGCVVIADRLPDRSFYRGSPVIEIDDWRQAPAIVRRLLRDPVKLEELHRAGLQFWSDMLSEQALAFRCASLLQLLPRIASAPLQKR
jgi:hypothetical protein